MTIQSKPPNDKYKENWDRIFGKKKNPEDNPIVNRNRELIRPKDRYQFEYPPLEDDDKGSCPTFYPNEEKK